MNAKEILDRHVHRTNTFNTYEAALCALEEVIDNVTIYVETRYSIDLISEFRSLVPDHIDAREFLVELATENIHLADFIRLIETGLVSFKGRAGVVEKPVGWHCGNCEHEDISTRKQPCSFCIDGSNFKQKQAK